MIAWALIDDVRIDSKMQRKRKKKTVFTITEWLTKIMTSNCLREI